MAITSKPAGTVSAPNTPTSETAGSVAIPNTPTAEAAGSVATPIAKTAKAAGSVAVPNSLTSEAAGSVAVPNSPTAKAAGTVAAPNSPTAETAGAVAAPNSLTAQGASIMPRALTPTLNLGFEGGLYAINGNPKSLSDIVTYTRASSATYTDCYVDEQNNKNYFLNTDYVGSVENLLTYSEQFDNAAWNKGAGSIVKNTGLGDDGLKSADRYDVLTTSSFAFLSQTLSGDASLQLTYSVWIKSVSGSRSLRLAISDVTTSTVQGSIEAITGKLKRYSFTIDAGTLTNSGSIGVGFIGLTSGDQVEVWGAQLTESAKPLPYVKTISSAVTQVFAETPRISFDPATGKSGYLAEGSATNLILRSEDFDTTWIKNAAPTVTVNDTIAPDLTKSADKLIKGVGNSFYQGVTVSATPYTFSVYYKKAVSSVNFNLLIDGISSGGIVSAAFNQDAEIVTITNTSAYTSVSQNTEALDNGWHRVSLTFTPDAAESVNLHIELATSGFIGYFWGAQVESGALPTSYIRTEGSTVSRSADVMSLSSAGIFNEGEGTIALDSKFNISPLIGDSTRYLLQIDDGTSSTRHLIYNNSGSNGGYFGIRGGALQWAINPSDTTTGFIESAFTYDSASVVAYLSGAQTGVDNTVIMPQGLTTIRIGTSSSGGTNANAIISELKIYDKVLTAQEVSLL